MPRLCHRARSASLTLLALLLAGVVTPARGQDPSTDPRPAPPRAEGDTRIDRCACRGTVACATLLTVATVATGQADTQRVQELGVTLEVPRTPEPERFPTALVWQRWGDGYLHLAVHDGTPPASNAALRRVVTRAVSGAELVTQGRTDHGALYGVYVANATVGGVSAGGSHMRMVADVALVSVSVGTGARPHLSGAGCDGAIDLLSAFDASGRAAERGCGRCLVGHGA